MGHETKIIQELDFVLTHPSCNAGVLEKFYSSWLYIYETVPLFTIVDHMRKAKPMLLHDWSKINNTVLKLLQELELNTEVQSGSATKTIRIDIDLAGQSPAKNGIFQVLWETDLDDPIVNAHFKTKSLVLFDKDIGKVDLVGISHVEAKKYHLYVKKGRKQL